MDRSKGDKVEHELNIPATIRNWSIRIQKRHISVQIAANGTWCKLHRNWPFVWQLNIFFLLCYTLSVLSDSLIYIWHQQNWWPFVRSGEILKCACAVVAREARWLALKLIAIENHVSLYTLKLIQLPVNCVWRQCHFLCHPWVTHASGLVYSVCVISSRSELSLWDFPVAVLLTLTTPTHPLPFFSLIVCKACTSMP